MISVEMEDVLAVLQLCKPYIIGIIAALVIGIVIMVACRRMSRDKRFLIRGEAVIAIDRKSTRLNSSHASKSRMPSSA